MPNEIQFMSEQAGLAIRDWVSSLTPILPNGLMTRKILEQGTDYTYIVEDTYRDITIPNYTLYLSPYFSFYLTNHQTYTNSTSVDYYLSYGSKENFTFFNIDTANISLGGYQIVDTQIDSTGKQLTINAVHDFMYGIAYPVDFKVILTINNPYIDISIEASSNNWPGDHPNGGINITLSNIYLPILSYTESVFYGVDISTTFAKPLEALDRLDLRINANFAGNEESALGVIRINDFSLFGSAIPILFVQFPEFGNQIINIPLDSTVDGNVIHFVISVLDENGYGYGYGIDGGMQINNVSIDQILKTEVVS